MAASKKAGSMGMNSNTKSADERLRSGLYGNASEYVCELIRRDEEAARHLRALYQAGIDSCESIPLSDADWAALRKLAHLPAAGPA